MLGGRVRTSEGGLFSTVGRGERSLNRLRALRLLSLPKSQPRTGLTRCCSRVGRGFGRRVVVRVCLWVWMVLRFVTV